MSTDAERFRQAIAIVESNDNPDVGLGDAGRAFGRYQVHPDWVGSWSYRLVVHPQVGDTWDKWCGRLVEAFFIHCVSIGLDMSETAVYFHLGHPGGSDDAYRARFQAALSRVANG